MECAAVSPKLTAAWVHARLSAATDGQDGRVRMRQAYRCRRRGHGRRTVQAWPTTASTAYLADQGSDSDPGETAEWRDAFLALAASEGPARARYILDQLAVLGRDPHVGWSPELVTPYVNTVAVERQPAFPGDLAIEERLASLMRWNALAMVVRANHSYGELGGHIASYASAADLFETGFNHFFHAKDAGHGGDLVFFQPHSAPGVYARAFLEGRLTRPGPGPLPPGATAPAAGARGLSSYPHPYLMPDFWQFPTGSMGIGPISSIYHARFMRYLTHRNLLDCGSRTVRACSATARWTSPRA